MNTLTTCPCCSNRMIHCFHNHREFWFCRTCWQEMPNFAAKDHSPQNQIVSLSPKLIKLEQTVAV